MNKYFFLGWNNSYANCLYLFLCFCHGINIVNINSKLTRNYPSFILDPTLKWSEMTEHLRRDDANPSENIDQIIHQILA